MGGFKAPLATVICHLVSSLIHKSGPLVGHARRVVLDRDGDLWEIAAQETSTSCERSNAASSVAVSDVIDGGLDTLCPKNGEKIRILTRCNQKLNARTDPRSDILQVQVSGQASRSQRSFFWSNRAVALHLLSCSRTESCTGSLSAGLGSVWSGMAIETVGIMSKGRSRRSSTVQLGESRPDIP